MASEITVLKFGGSVLRNEDDLPRVVHSIYSHWRGGRRVIAVVSAFNGKTDELVSKSREYNPEPDPAAFATLLLTGETTSAAMLALSLNRSGIPVKLLTPEQAGIRTVGDPLDGEPVCANTERIRTELEHGVVIVSGFVGTNDAGDVTLLGRGGTDLTALFLAQLLGADCKLIKDVGALFEYDPASTNKSRKYVRASYGSALRLGGGLVQPKAIRFAESHRQQFEIASLGNKPGTTVGPFDDEFANDDNFLSRPLRVALLGCGTVGGGVFDRLSALPELFEIVGVVNLHPEKAIAAGVRSHQLCRSPHNLIECDSDVVIELIGGIEPARSLIEKALLLGRHVITANKAVMSHHGEALERLAAENGVTLRYSASVGGALPALETVAQAALLDPPNTVRGIINGTCNYICDRLSEGSDYQTAVKLAQDAGFTEADPTNDVNGTDAAQKLVLLAKASFGIRIAFESVDRTGIESLNPNAVDRAKNSGQTIRLVAECRRTSEGVEASVRPMAVSITHPFAKTRGADNCLLIEGANGSRRLIKARGAGRHATTESVLADLFDLQRHLSSPSNVLVREVAA